ncbi:MAG TPA: hypothetical protein ENH87_11915 [Pricia antarctica]|uniref:Uncharacterized protein n=1 Tax=Pricia antarctica TaxID=641691 RepID=A0A831QRJ5_9FLAO|nr:hypothetical protein [Pricia antarctica]
MGNRDHKIHMVFPYVRFRHLAGLAFAGHGYISTSALRAPFNMIATLVYFRVWFPIFTHRANKDHGQKDMTASGRNGYQEAINHTDYRKGLGGGLKQLYP